MGLYSKGTRSKGVTKAFQKQNQANTLQRTKHQKRDAFLEKERFMKEAMAKHLAVQTTMVANAVEGAGGGTGGVTSDSKADLAAVPTHSSFPKIDANAAALASTEKKRKSKDTAPRPKLRSTMATVSGMHMPGSMRWEGKNRPVVKGKSEDGAVGANSLANSLANGVAKTDGESIYDKNRKIGHLMKPLTGDEIDFTTTVDTNVKLPKYARGKQTVVKKRKKNKKRNARAKHMGE